MSISKPRIKYALAVIFQLNYPRDRLKKLLIYTRETLGNSGVYQNVPARDARSQFSQPYFCGETASFLFARPRQPSTYTREKPRNRTEIYLDRCGETCRGPARRFLTGRWPLSSLLPFWPPDRTYADSSYSFETIHYG